MKSTVRSLAVLAVLGLFMPRSAAAFVSEQDWQYVQSVGGMRLGQPQQKEGNWTVPVEIDVTGSRPITTQPTAQHPGLVCAGIQAEPHDAEIYLTLFTSYPWLGADKGGGCQPIVLGHLTTGHYTLYYKGLDEQPIKLADLNIP
jgi:hypothetical protein